MFGWRIRGTRGFGAIPGCIFAGLLFAMAWYMLAREPGERKTRRYSSGWAVLAITVMIALGGMHGWMQWRSWLMGVFPLVSAFEGPAVNPVYGYSWLFVCAMPWIGLGAVGIAWTANDVSLPGKAWVFRILSGCAGGAIAYGAWFLLRPAIIPMWDTLPYPTCNNCDDAIEDTTTSVVFLGFYAGFIVFEAIRKDWTNVKLALLPGIVGGVGWMVIMGAMYSGYTGPNPSNWAYWELLAGIPFGLGLGVAFYLYNSPRPTGTPYTRPAPPGNQPEKRNLELVLGIYFPVVVSCISIANSTGEGWMSCFTGERPEFVPSFVIPAAVAVAAIFLLRLTVLRRKRPFMPGDGRDNTVEFPVLFWCMLGYQVACGVVVAVVDACEGLLCAVPGSWTLSKCLFFPVTHLVLLGVDVAVLAALRLLRKHSIV
jgi:hypothetical protein